MSDNQVGAVALSSPGASPALFVFAQSVLRAGLAAAFAAASVELAHYIANRAEVDDGVLFAGTDCLVTYTVMAALASLLLDVPAFRLRRQSVPLPVFIIGLSVLSMVAAAVIGSLILRHFANSADEWGYLFQAQTYVHGRLINPAPVLGQAMAACWTWVVGNGWVGQYPPGWPLILSGFGLAGLPYWGAGLAIGGLTIALLAVLTWQSAKDSRATLLVAITWAVSPFLLFNAASYYSHAATGAFCLAFAVLGTQYLQGGRLAAACAAGAMLGAVASIRYAPAAFLGVPYVIALLTTPGRRLPGLFWLGVGMLPFVAGIAYYQYLLTGDPLKPVYWVGGRKLDHLYFDPVTLLAGMQDLVAKGAELGDWLFPLALPGYFVALLWKLRARTATFVDFLALALIVGILFYPFDPGNRYGPRYWFEAAPFMVFTIVTALFESTPFGSARRRAALTAFVVAGPVFALAAMPFGMRSWFDTIADRMTLSDEIAERGLNNAVVIVRDASGTDDPMGVDDLIRNDIDAAGPVLFVNGNATSVSKVVRAFPGRSIWLWDGHLALYRGR